MDDGLTIVQEVKEEKAKVPTVQIYLPKLEEEGNGVKVDQYEHVTIANENKEETFYVKRGERVDVPVNVYVVMKEKYPDL
jgi:hypothetical protein